VLPDLLRCAASVWVWRALGIRSARLGLLRLQRARRIQHDGPPAHPARKGGRSSRVIRLVRIAADEADAVEVGNLRVASKENMGAIDHHAGAVAPQARDTRDTGCRLARGVAEKGFKLRDSAATPSTGGGGGCLRWRTSLCEWRQPSFFPIRHRHQMGEFAGSTTIGQFDPTGWCVSLLKCVFGSPRWVKNHLGANFGVILGNRKSWARQHGSTAAR